MDGGQHSIVLFAASTLKRMTTFNSQQQIQFHAGLKEVPYPHCSRLNYFHVAYRMKQQDGYKQNATTYRHTQDGNESGSRTPHNQQKCI